MDSLNWPIFKENRLIKTDLRPFLCHFIGNVNCLAWPDPLALYSVEHDNLGTGGYVFHGLESDVIDGQWHTFVRDLQSDLEEAQPGVTILEVNGFLIRGSGWVDDIKLHRQQ